MKQVSATNTMNTMSGDLPPSLKSDEQVFTHWTIEDIKKGSVVLANAGTKILTKVKSHVQWIRTDIKEEKFLKEVNRIETLQLINRIYQDTSDEKIEMIVEKSCRALLQLRKQYKNLNRERISTNFIQKIEHLLKLEKQAELQNDKMQVEKLQLQRQFVYLKWKFAYQILTSSFENQLNSKLERIQRNRSDRYLAEKTKQAEAAYQALQLEKKLKAKVKTKIYTGPKVPAC